jgi:hypothetical protein
MVFNPPKWPICADVRQAVSQQAWQTATAECRKQVGVGPLELDAAAARAAHRGGY